MGSTKLRRGLLAGAAAISVSGCAPAVILAGAGAVAGASVVQERTTADQVSDLETRISLANGLQGHSAGLARAVGVEVVEGRVLLTGSVPEPQESIAATNIAWAAPGVNEVINEIAVGEGGGVKRYAEDAWISAQVRSELIADGRIAALNYNVETHDGVVHLMGLARSQSELTRVADLAAATPGVRQVVSHVLMIDDPRRKAP